MCQAEGTALTKAQRPQYMSHVWREVVEREKGPEQLPPPNLATQGPRFMGVWLGCGFAHGQDPPCDPGGHSLGLAKSLALTSPLGP